MSCSDVQTIKAGNGSQLTFSFDFPYIFKSEIHVYFWNATTKEYDEKLTTDSTYPWRITDANPTIVEFTSTAPPSPTTPSDPGEPTVDNVKIRRITQVDDIRALFNPGSAIRSDDLNKNFEQLRYAIQESNCQGIPDDVDQYLKDYYWDRYDNTLYDGDTWVSDDTKIATTAALDARFQDEVNDTFTKAELAAASNIMPNDDVAVPTTGALDDYIDEVITNDIGSSDGVSITDDGDGTITIGLTDSSVDFDKIKDSDQIQLADQVADPDVEGTDNNIFTARAATRRFNNYYQNDAPTDTDGIGLGQVWVDPNDDLTLSVWTGSAWSSITSGGTFTNQPKVVYVDASSGDDSNDGHRISRPKKTIAAALSDINGDSEGDGSIVSVAPGIYAETLPLDIQKNDIGIIGQSLRTCIIHPKIPTADQSGYDVDTPHSQELQTMFRVNSGSYFQNLTLTGMKASGTRGDSGSYYTDSTHGLPPNQGWNFAFYPDAQIKKSPYIQNVTNFSDSQINNVTFTPHVPGEGAAGDLDSAPTGGGILVDGSVPASDSPLRSMVCDSYTHTALDGPGILVTNNGYLQATSSYAFFNHAHITCLNGGQANLAASTTDFGRFGLIADGKSPNPIFTSTVDGAASDGATTFNIDAPTAGSNLYGGSEAWFGDAERPATNMLVEVNSVIYPILSATANGSGWTVEVSRPDSSNRSTNLGLNGAISDAATVNFYLRSMIASSGHTMEYVGSGTDYNALPENGGVPDENDQKIELNNGKIWTAITDHNGKFTIGGNQTDDPFFEVDQQLGFVTIPEGSIAFNLLSDETPQLGGNLDVNGNTITSTSNANVVIDPNGTGTVDVSTSRITSVTDPTGVQDAATKNYVDTNFNNYTHPNHTGDVTSTGDGATVIANDAVTSAKIADDAVGADQLADTSVTAGSYTSADITVDAQGRITAASSGSAGAADKIEEGNTSVECVDTGSDGHITFDTEGSERMRIDNSGDVGIGTTSPGTKLHVNGTTPTMRVSNGTTQIVELKADTSASILRTTTNHPLLFGTNDNERMRIDSSGNVGIGTSSPSSDGGTTLEIYNASTPTLRLNDGGEYKALFQLRGNDLEIRGSNGGMEFYTGNADGASSTERMRLSSDGKLLIGSDTGSVHPDRLLQVGKTDRSETYISIVASTSGESGLLFADTTTNDTGGYRGQIRYHHSDDSMNFRTAATERMRIDSSGRLLVGASSARTNFNNGSASPQVQIENVANGNNSSIALIHNENALSDSSALNFGKTRGGSVGDNSALNQAGDRLGAITFQGNDGTEFVQAASIEGFTDATPGNNDMPGRLVFSTTADGASSVSERMRLDSSGRLLIGTTTEGYSSADNFTVADSGNCGITIRSGISQNGTVAFSDATSGDAEYDGYIQYSQANQRLVLATDSTERMRIASNGEQQHFGTNATSLNIANTASAGNQYEFFYCQHSSTGLATGTNSFRVATDGDVFNTNNSYGSLSDQRLKENIVDATSQWDDIKGLQVRKYNFREDTGHETHTQLGLIAQEVESVSPGLVETSTVKEGETVLDADGNQLESIKSINYSVLYMKAVKALQEAMDRIETLETKVAALEAG